MMKKVKLYTEFEELGQRLGLKILKGKGDFSGGTCTVNSETVIVINKMKPMEQRLRTLATSFLEYNLDEIYMVPALRAYIEESRLLDL
ncbi:MAG: hypothetical protein NZ838_03630 [Candidatus Marinimicrobia bacterium]|jgi:hypothetical protein|nr:hypothetical protein [Candidatus Neomarinimicrobiota bacterium]MEC7736854.1 hypothetical protein [Candidatus Neomarinimicrobiota bacterium]|tara:strand:- start:2046 stop:2309 length:264 start_codon:yes stop_codon:yes gene_type:complete